MKPRAKQTDGERAVSLLKKFYGLGSAKRHSLGSRAFDALSKLGRRLTHTRTIRGADNFIQFLKTYSSYTPLLIKSSAPEKFGGGYFAALGGIGCVIDPGHHFLDNFLRARRSIYDIDCIIVTHFHDDHYADLPALLSLLHQRFNDDRKKRKIELLLDKKTYSVLRFGIGKSNYVRRIRKLRSGPGRPMRLTGPHMPPVFLKALPTKHKVLRQHSGVGLAFDIRARNACLLITGDTAWAPEIGRAYRTFRPRRPVLVAHISTVYRREMPDALRTERECFHPNHLCVHGLCKAIEATDARCVILSEIGQELDAVVKKLALLIKNTYGRECEVGWKGHEYYFD
jgi:ribonuclease BN (tRNA processing enzyme)